eukprot:scaffold154513_cov28-Tisochrysis_lutea.AAC.2
MVACTSMTCTTPRSLACAAEMCVSVGTDERFKGWRPNLTAPRCERLGLRDGVPRRFGDILQLPAHHGVLRLIRNLPDKRSHSKDYVSCPARLAPACLESAPLG